MGLSIHRDWSLGFMSVFLALAMISSPFLAEDGVAGAVFANSVEKPDVIEFGQSVADAAEALKPFCDTQEIREFTPPRIPIAETSHSQIDCRGFWFMGEHRVAEFVFADDGLVLVWVLVDADDQDRILTQMRQQYDSDGIDVDVAIAFPENGTAWRFEPPEVLYYSDKAAPLFGSRLSQP